MRPLAKLLRRLFGPREETAAQAVPEKEQQLPGGELPQGSGASAPSAGGGMPPGAAGIGAPSGGEMPGSAAAGTAAFSGGTVRGSAEGAAGLSGGELPGRGAGFEAREEVLPLAGPPEDGARLLSELLRFQRRMGSTVGEFGEEVL